MCSILSGGRRFVFDRMEDKVEGEYIRKYDNREQKQPGYLRTHQSRRVIPRTKKERKKKMKEKI